MSELASGTSTFVYDAAGNVIEFHDEAREALEGMVRQFAYWSDSAGGLTTGGLSDLEQAFTVLGWDDPHPVPEMRCDEPGCLHKYSSGTPTPTGYRWTCHEHRPQ